MKNLFDKSAGSVLRNLVRAVIATVTAFGFRLSGEQVGAIMLLLEAVMASGQLLVGRGKPKP